MVSDLVHQMAEGFGRAIDAKDPFTKNHSDEVAVLARLTARAMGLAPAMADAVHVAGHLHDVGKIGVPDMVLRKTGPLTPEEWAQVREHPRTGAAILAPVQCLSDMAIPEMVLCHHERFDGRGYPLGLKQTAIPLGARIIAVADSFSAMLQKRPYRGAMSMAQACAEIRLGMGSQFDPNVARAFLSLQRRDLARAMELKEPAPGNLSEA